MGLMDNLKRLARPFDDEEFEEYAEQAAPAIPSAAPGVGITQEFPEKRNKVVNIHATAQLQVVLLKPEQFENAREIADHLRDKRTVVLNMENTPPS